MLKLTKDQLSSNSLLNWLLQDKPPSLRDSEQFTRDVFFNKLEHSFTNLKKPIDTCRIELQEFNIDDYIGTPMSSVAEVARIIDGTGFFKHFLINGSTADLNCIDGWSDFDAMAIVSKEAFTASSRAEFFNLCCQLDDVMRRIDPHQHHGIHFIHVNELTSFPNLYLPINIIEDCKCLLGSSYVTITGVNSLDFEKSRFHAIVKTLKSAAADGVLRHHAKDGKYLLSNYQDMNVMYQLKYFLCLIMLMPALWLNLRGVYCDKPKSYQLIEKFFDPDELEILHAASKIRSLWSPGLNNANLIPQLAVEVLGDNYLQRAAIYANTFMDRL